MKIKLALNIGLLLGSLSFIHCDQQEPISSYSSPVIIEMTSEVEKFLNEALFIMENNSIKRNLVDWDQVREEVMEHAKGLKTVPEAYPSVQLAFQLINDYHSALLSPGGDFFRGPEPECEAALVITPPTVPEEIGYLKLPKFHGTGDDGARFAEEIQDVIRSIDHAGLEGWIIDLRANTGGNMWAMLAAVGPILGEGTVGHFVDTYENELAWQYLDGSAILVENAITTVSDPYRLVTPLPQVAILTDNYTASAGEAIGIAFNGRPDTKRFGTPTCGLTTANKQFELTNGDGESLLLSFAHMADRDLNLFNEPVVPDQIITDVDKVVLEAIDWIKNE